MFTLIVHYSFSLSLQAQNLPFQQILPTVILLLPWTAFTITGPNRTYTMLLDLFVVRFFFDFSVVPCGGLSWLLVSSVCPVWRTKLATRQLCLSRVVD